MVGSHGWGGHSIRQKPQDHPSRAICLISHQSRANTPIHLPSIGLLNVPLGTRVLPTLVYGVCELPHLCVCVCMHGDAAGAWASGLEAVTWLSLRED